MGCIAKSNTLPLFAVKIDGFLRGNLSKDVTTDMHHQSMSFKLCLKVIDLQVGVFAHVIFPDRTGFSTVPNQYRPNAQQLNSLL